MGENEAGGAVIPLAAKQKGGRKPRTYAADRVRALEDVYFLASEVLGYKDLVPRVHRPICEFFHRKNNLRSIQEQVGHRQRQILYPRGSFKTTLDIADTISWILNFPDVRILLMSGTRDLSVRLVHEIKSHFTGNAKLRRLFPEFCPPEGKDFGSMDEFTVPARKLARLREPTVSISTTESVKAGSHFDVVKLDDPVTEQNSATPEQLEKTWRAINYTEPLLDPGGFRDLIGTRYHVDDAYGRVLAQQADDWLVLQAPAWKLKPGANKDSDREEDYDLLFPERLSWKFLRRVQRSDGWLFAAQYLNDPRERSRARMDRDKLLRHTVPVTQLPTKGPIFQTWDLAYSNKPGRDYTCGLTGRFDAQGRLWVIDAVRERLSTSELVTAIVEQARKHMPQRIGIEASVGAQFIETQLRLSAADAGAPMPLEWLKIGREKGSKLGRILSLEPWLERDALWFSAALPGLNFLLEELENAGSSRYDDMADALANLTRFRDVPETNWFSQRRPVEEEPSLASARISPAYSDDVCGYGMPG